MFAFTTTGKVLRIDPEQGTVVAAVAVASPRGLAWTWDHQPPGLRHEFVRLILGRVVIHADYHHVEATLTWRTGAQQHLWIERPLGRRSGKVPWTEADNTWLQAHYAVSTREALQARFPYRTYLAIREQAAALGLTRRQKGVAKPKGARGDAAENARLRAYAAGQLSAAELQALLPGRTWDGIEHQARVLGLRFQGKPVYYHLVPDVREMISEEDSSMMVW